MDRLTTDQVNALHIVAAATEGYKPEDGCTSLCVDYDHELVVYTDSNGDNHIINCALDSWSAVFKDFIRQFLSENVKWF